MICSKSHTKNFSFDCCQELSERNLTNIRFSTVQINDTEINPNYHKGFELSSGFGHLAWIMSVSKPCQIREMSGLVGGQRGVGGMLRGIHLDSFDLQWKE